MQSEKFSFQAILFIITEVLSFLNRKWVSQCPTYYHFFLYIFSVWLFTTHLGLIFIVILLYFQFHWNKSCLWGSIKCNLLCICDFLALFSVLQFYYRVSMWICQGHLNSNPAFFPVLTAFLCFGSSTVSTGVYHCSGLKKYWAKCKKYSYSISFAVLPFPASKMWIATKGHIFSTNWISMESTNAVVISSEQVNIEPLVYILCQPFKILSILVLDQMVFE